MGNKEEYMLGKLLGRVKRVPQPEMHPKFTPMIEAIEQHVKEVHRYFYSHTLDVIQKFI